MFAKIPDVRVKIHGFLIERVWGAWYLHGAGEHSLQGQQRCQDAGVHRHIVHQTPPHRCCCNITLMLLLLTPDNLKCRNSRNYLHL